MGKYQFYQDCKVTAWDVIISLWKLKATKMRKPLSVHGNVKMFRISLTAVCATTNGVRYPIHRNVCPPMKTVAVRQSRYITLFEKLL